MAKKNLTQIMLREPGRFPMPRRKTEYKAAGLFYAAAISQPENSLAFRANHAVYPPDPCAARHEGANPPDTIWWLPASRPHTTILKHHPAWPCTRNAFVPRSARTGGSDHPEKALALQPPTRIYDATPARIR